MRRGLRMQEKEGREGANLRDLLDNLGLDSTLPIQDRKILQKNRKANVAEKISLWQCTCRINFLQLLWERSFKPQLPSAGFAILRCYR